MTLKDIAKQLTTAVQTVPNLVQILRDGLEQATAGSTVEVTQVQESGTKIATISIDDEDTDIYAPASQHIYSTTEHVVGKWTDNKDVYEKVITTSEVTLSNGTAVELNLNDYLTGYDKLIKVDTVQNSANRSLPANMLPSNLQAYGVAIDVNFSTGKIIIRSGASVSTTDTFTLIISYTKTAS